MLRRLLAPACAAMLCACAAGAPGAAGPAATARLLPARAPGAQGTVDLRQADGLVRVYGAIGGLAPNTQYRLRVLDSAGCGAPGDGPAAGPAAAGTGPAPADRLPDLHADATGTATFSFDVRGLSLDGPAGVLGRGLAVQAGPSDRAAGASDGAAGRRLACGTIRPR